MKKLLFFICLLIAGQAIAQETITLPSSFDENKMIVKKRDAKGNYIPMNQAGAEGIEKGQKKGKTGTSQIDRKAVASQKMDDIQKRISKMNFDKTKTNRRRTLDELKEQKKQEEERKTGTEEKEGEEQSQKQRHTRKMRAIERNYGIQKTTFGEDTLKKVEVPQNPTFKAPTMSKAMMDFKKESIQYKECDDSDPNCKLYEVDEKGQVINK